MSRKAPEKPARPLTQAARRQQRLAEALRANLKRRKAARASDTSGKPEAGPEANDE